MKMTRSIDYGQSFRNCVRGEVRKQKIVLFCDDNLKSHGTTVKHKYFFKSSSSSRHFIQVVLHKSQIKYFGNVVRLILFICKSGSMNWAGEFRLL